MAGDACSNQLSCRLEDPESADVDAILTLSRRRAIATEFGHVVGVTYLAELLRDYGAVGLGGTSSGRFSSEPCKQDPVRLVLRVPNVAV